MRQISIYEAKTQLSKYIALIESGEENEIIILKNGKEVAKIVPSNSNKQRLGAGLKFSKPLEFKLKDENDNFDELFGY